MTIYRTITSFLSQNISEQVQTTDEALTTLIREYRSGVDKAFLLQFKKELIELCRKNEESQGLIVYDLLGDIQKDIPLSCEDIVLILNKLILEIEKNKEHHKLWQ